MSASLRDRAAGNGQPEPATVPRTADTTVASLEPIEYTDPISDAEKVPVHTAWARVMADVQSIRKSDQRNDVGGRYSFRGVDTVLNAVGPALRRHGVLVLPTKVLSVEYRESRTKSGTVMQDCTVTVQWTVIGPAGDALPPLESAGQATDTQDKATSKAMSVSQRVLFLGALHVPTEDPQVDVGHDRGERPTPKPAEYRDEAVDPRTSMGRLRALRAEVVRYGLAGASVVNENGDEESLKDLIDRIGRERRATEGGEA